jgi:hypothetical protein
MRDELAGSVRLEHCEQREPHAGCGANGVLDQRPIGAVGLEPFAHHPLVLFGLVQMLGEA